MCSHEIGRQWREAEGTFLQKLGVSAEDRDKSLQRCLEDPALRDEVRRRLGVTQTLVAVVAANGLSLSQDELLDFVVSQAVQTDLSIEELDAELSMNPEAVQQAGKMALYSKAVDLVMSKAKVEIGG